LSKDLTRAQVERIGLESQVELIHHRQYGSLPVVMNDRLVQTMQTELNQLVAQDASLADQFTGAYPPLAQLRAKENAIKGRLSQEIQDSIKGIESSYQQALEKERELNAEMQRQRALTMTLNDIAWLLFITPIAPFMIQNVAIGVAILNDKRQTLPRWVGYVNFWIAFSFIPDPLAFFFHSGPFAWRGIFIFWLALTTYSVFLIVMGLTLRKAIRESADPNLPAVAATPV